MSTVLLSALLACVLFAAGLRAYFTLGKSPFDGLAPMSVWVEGDARKVRPTDAPRADVKTASLYAARGEVAAFQVIVTAHKQELTGVDLKASSLTCDGGSEIPAEKITLFRQAMLNITKPSHIKPRKGGLGEWPDALIPIGPDRYFHERRNGAPFNVRKDTNQPVWIEVAVPANASAGDYRGTITVSAIGQSPIEVPVSLHVWNFAIPQTSSLPTTFGIGAAERIRHHLNPADTLHLARLYAREALRNRVSLWGMWFLNGLPYYEYDPADPDVAPIADWSRYDDLYREAMSGTPEGRATTIDVPAQTTLRSEIAPPTARLDGVDDDGKLGSGTYVYRITAVNAEGETEGSATVTARIANKGAVRLSWSEVVHKKWPRLNARCYNIYRVHNPRIPENDNPATYRMDTVVDTSYTDTGDRVTHMSIPCPNANGTGDREALAVYRAWASHLREKDWLDRAYFYAEDEPFTSKELERARKHALLWRKAVPDGWSLVTNVYSPDLDGAVNLWCVVLNWFDDGVHGRASDISKRQGKGERVWWYQGMMSRDKARSLRGAWPSYFVDDTAMAARITGFFTWRYGFEGILYYLMDMAYQPDNDPWVNQFYFEANGDGTLFYPGTPDKIGGNHDIPIASLRLALIRQGLQDYEYLKMVADLGDKEFANRQAALLVQAPDRFTNDRDAERVAAVRIALAKRIEALQTLR